MMLMTWRVLLTHAFTSPLGRAARHGKMRTLGDE